MMCDRCGKDMQQHEYETEAIHLRVISSYNKTPLRMTLCGECSHGLALYLTPELADDTATTQALSVMRKELDDRLP